MKKFDLSSIETVVGTQYGDMRGYIEVDFHNNISDLIQLLRSKGIDMDRYSPFAIEIYDSEPIGGCRMCKVYLIDGDIYGHSFDKISNHKGEIEVVVEKFDLKYSELCVCLKRLSIALVTPISTQIKVNFVDKD